MRKARKFAGQVDMTLQCDQASVVYADVHQLASRVAPGMIMSSHNDSSIELRFEVAFPAGVPISAWQGAVDSLVAKVDDLAGAVLARHGAHGTLVAGEPRVLFELS